MLDKSKPGFFDKHRRRGSHTCPAHVRIRPERSTAPFTAVYYAFADRRAQEQALEQVIARIALLREGQA